MNDEAGMGDNLYSGSCTGGPLHGRKVTVRSADGFLAADKAAGRAWIYKRQPDGSFTVCTDHDDSLVHPDGPQTGERELDTARVWQAGTDSTLDILAVES
jgi:hypothetical protein